MIGRRDTWFWRFFGFIAIVVLLLNTVVLVQKEGPCKLNDPSFQHTERVKPRNGNRSRTTVPPKIVISKSQSNSLKIEIKNPSPLKIVISKPQSNASKIEISNPSTPKTEISQHQTNLTKMEIKHPLWLQITNMDTYFKSDEILLLGKKKKNPGYLVFGVPTVRRKKAYYLINTIKGLVDNLKIKDRNSVIIVIFVADEEASYRSKVINDIKTSFLSEVNDGLIQVIYAPKKYYPKKYNSPLLYGDKEERVIWRSKQSLDYSFLYYYCANLSKYYVQLEDDLSIDKDYFTKIKKYLDLRRNETWSTIEFGASGFIGMTYRSSNLRSLAKFARFYFWTMPIDWIFRVYNNIYLYGNNKKDIFKPPIFKHIGHFSSLDGQIRKIATPKKKKDTTVRKYQSKEGNPPGTITTSIPDFEAKHTIQKPYEKEDYFWGKTIKSGQYIQITLKKPTLISRIVIASGNLYHPSDALLDSTLSIGSRLYNDRCEDLRTVARFRNTAIIDQVFSNKTEISCLQLTLDKVRSDGRGHNKWLIIEEIALL